MKQVIIIIAIIAVIVCIGVAIGYLIHQPAVNLGLETSSFINYGGDLVGTKVGTTTTGVNFRVTASGGQSATSSYITKIGSANKAVITNQIMKASSTANLHFSLLGSNDFGCATSSASTDNTVDMPLPSEIAWFDIGDHLLNKVHSTSLPVGTSTLQWVNPKAGTGQPIILDSLSYECLNFQVSGSSTVLRSQIRLK